MQIRKADYVIVGGGTAGCVLAARLTEDPSVSVVLLEAGPRYRGLYIHMPAALGALYERGDYHWSYRARPEPFANNKVLDYKLGRILGGSSAINGLVWARGNPLDFDDWAQAGCEGWAYADIEPLYRRIESFEDRSDPAMGYDGPIPVARGRPEEQTLSAAFMKSAGEAGYRINPNHNSGDQEGFCALQRNTACGRRGDVYQGYLHPAWRRKNLTILPDLTVRRILMDGRRAIGVEVKDHAGPVCYQAEREVLLCAGSIASPQLLELTGIGDRRILKKAGIAVQHHLPGVGQNFHTHPTIALTYSCSKPVSILNSTRGIGKIRAGLRWLLTRTGPAATNHFEAGAFLKSDPKADRPDYQLTFLPLALSGMTSAVDAHGLQIYIELIGCKSRGQTHVTSPEVTRQPEFGFNFLEDPRDVEIYQKAVATVRRLAAQPALAALIDRELVPGVEASSDADIEAWIRKYASVSHHLVGSCKMGPADDPMAVVGPDLCVHGVEGLRVIDASIMPTVTSANTHATTIAIAEKGADIIRYVKTRTPTR
ncbi:MAG: NAD(P)-binding protein [Gammaproteobacteria bacterium]|nr:NAD(P)-binding protein [Gammaproteobacteria bacterium]